MGGLIFLRALVEQSLVLTNKNVIQDSINNEKDLSCTHRNLHFKTHIHIKSRETCSSSNSSPQARWQSVTETEAPSQTHTSHLSTLALLSVLWWHGSRSPCYSATSHAEIAKQTAVKGICVLGSKQVLSCHITKKNDSLSAYCIIVNIIQHRIWRGQAAGR